MSLRDIDLVGLGYAYQDRDNAEVRTNAAVDRALRELEKEGKNRAQYMIIGVGIYDEDEHVGAMSRTSIAINGLSKSVLLNGTIQHILNGMMKENSGMKTFMLKLRFCISLLFPWMKGILKVYDIGGLGSLNGADDWTSVGHPSERYDSRKTFPARSSKKG